MGQRIHNRHKKLAEHLAQQLPDDIDEAVLVLMYLAAMLGRASNSVDLSDLTSISTVFPL